MSLISKSTTRKTETTSLINDLQTNLLIHTTHLLPPQKL